MNKLNDFDLDIKNKDTKDSSENTELIFSISFCTPGTSHQPCSDWCLASHLLCGKE